MLPEGVLNVEILRLRRACDEEHRESGCDRCNTPHPNAS